MGLTEIYGRSDGTGYGYSEPYIYGYGYGLGDRDGIGYGLNSGHGYGHGYCEITLDKESPMTAYHCIRKYKDGYLRRNGQYVEFKQHIHEDQIKLQEKGLHANLSIKDALAYSPSGSVLTKVHIWGDVKFCCNKLVATDRMIVEELT